MTFRELAAVARGALPAGAAEGSDAEEQHLAESLHALLLRGGIDASLDPPQLAATPGERPLADRLARFQAREGRLVTSLDHCVVDLHDDDVRSLIQRLDGTLDRPGLAAAMPQLGAEKIEHALAQLARLSLLVR
jgi:hypothetical protein